jgi:hypothetical protein
MSRIDDIILEGTCAPLVALGMRKRKGLIFTIELTSDVLGRLAFNVATEHAQTGTVEVNPLVGVRFQEVERLITECMNRKFHAYSPSTIYLPLGYLMPEKRYTSWEFSAENTVAVGHSLVNAFAIHGLPFMHSVVTYPALLAQINARNGFDDQLAWSLPVAQLLAGQPEAARKTLDRQIAERAERTGGAEEAFRAFATALRAKLPVN